MFEKRLKEISKEIGGEESRNKFYILTHKKNRREIYFQNKKESIKFLSKKLNSPLKKLRKVKKFTNILIKIGILQPFLKKIELSSKMGDVIFVANQIKSFDLESKYAYSFIKNEKNKDSFIQSKKFQKELAKKRFAPEILEINTKIPFSKEELLSEYKGGDDISVFKKLYSFYEIEGIKSISLNEYINSLERKIKEKKIKNELIQKSLRDVYFSYSKNIKIKIVQCHGSFTREQILKKDGSYVFTDWGLNEKNLIIRDLRNYFRKEENLLKNKKFRELLKIYPQDVQRDIELYIMLNEVYSMIRRKTVEDFPKKRIENVLKDI